MLANILATTTNTVVEKTTNSIPINSPIKPVTPAEFTSKFTESTNMILDVLGSMVIPIVSICFLLSIITYVMGGILHSDKIRKTGAAGVGASALGYFIYMISPYIMGLLYSIAQIFQ